MNWASATLVLGTVFTAGFWVGASLFCGGSEGNAALRLQNGLLKLRVAMFVFSGKLGKEIARRKKKEAQGNSLTISAQ